MAGVAGVDDLDDIGVSQPADDAHLAQEEVAGVTSLPLAAIPTQANLSARSRPRPRAAPPTPCPSRPRRWDAGGDSGQRRRLLLPWQRGTNCASRALFLPTRADAPHHGRAGPPAASSHPLRCGAHLWRPTGGGYRVEGAHPSLPHRGTLALGNDQSHTPHSRRTPCPVPEVKRKSCVPYRRIFRNGWS